jgi:SAM-dependent methyltransferase
METVREEFDRIALVSELHSPHDAGRYADFLLRQVPARCEQALEIGCGTGAFSRRLAGRAAHVLAFDLSPQMIRVARERSAQTPNIEFLVADVLAHEIPRGGFDCAVAVATLHHLPMELMLLKLKAALREGGKLLVLDLFQPEGVRDRLADLVAFPVSTILRLLTEGRLRPPPEVRAAWAEHEKHDTYLTLRQVRDVCAKLLPGARVRRHLLWRYSIVWRKPIESTHERIENQISGQPAADRAAHR